MFFTVSEAGETEKDKPLLCEACRYEAHLLVAFVFRFSVQAHGNVRAVLAEMKKSLKGKHSEIDVTAVADEVRVRSRNFHASGRNLHIEIRFVKLTTLDHINLYHQK